MAVPTASLPPGTAVGAEDRASRRRATNRKDNKLAFLMLAPLVLLLGIFVIWPLIYSAYLSFFDWSFYQESTFVGWKNFNNVLTDPQFRSSIVRGLVFALMVVPAILVISFLFASLVKAVGARLGTLLKVAIYIPTVISGVITS